MCQGCTLTFAVGPSGVVVHILKQLSPHVPSLFPGESCRTFVTIIHSSFIRNSTSLVSLPRIIAMSDKLESEQWPHETRFKNWKTSLQREVITTSFRSRQVTDWSSETDAAISTQDMDGAGSVFGCTRMHLETLDSQIAEGFFAHHELRIQEKKSSYRNDAREERSPDVDRKAHRLHDQRRLQDQRCMASH